MNAMSIERVRPGLGTFVAVRCCAKAPSAAEGALESAFASVAFIERLMHPTRVGSDLAAIRSTGLGHGVRVHPWTWQVLELSRRLNEVSGGRFDPCLPTACGRITDVDLPEPNIVVCRAAVVVDLGGIAKGFAVDQAVASLLAAGCVAGQVNAGGDLRVFGPEDRPIWIRTSTGAWPITLRERACAVSDPKHSARPSEHQGYYNRNRSDVEASPLGTRAAVVVAPTAAVADALTKCILLEGAADDRDMLAGLDAESLTLEAPEPAR